MNNFHTLLTLDNKLLQTDVSIVLKCFPSSLFLNEELFEILDFDYISVFKYVKKNAL